MATAGWLFHQLRTANSNIAGDLLYRSRCLLRASESPRKSRPLLTICRLYESTRMVMDFDKLVTTLTSPLDLSLIALATGLALMRFARIRLVGVLLVSGSTMLLLASSTPLISRALITYWERPFPTHPVDQYPNVDVVIILGGGIRVGGGMPYPDLQDASDRLLHGFRILRAGKARKVIVTGGGNPIAGTVAGAMAAQLEEWGIPKEDILIEDYSRTTFENAIEASVIWQKEKFTSGLLITSAFHMPRALATFQKAGMNVAPASTDSLITDRDPDFPLGYLPNAEALNNTSLVWKEIIGLFIYRWRGAL